MSSISQLFRFRLPLIAGLATPHPSRHPARRSRWAALCLGLAVMACVFCHSAAAQSGEWTWMGGSDMIDQPGVYGILGTPAPGNIPGGRWDAVSWTDSSGNLWLFGGSGLNAKGNWKNLNDLWEFNPSTNKWAWMSGSGTIGDDCDAPGVYGTLGIPAAGNVPGARDGIASWTDSSGNLWLFGDYCYNSYNYVYVFLNDLWKFNPSTDEWAWMGGSSNTIDQPVNYGTLGIPAAGNFPGTRYGAMSWTDSSGNFWLFGGAGLNDLWEFNPSTDQWAWMGGSKIREQPGVYGTLNTPAAGNIPGCHEEAVSWTDNKGNLWLFGGNGLDANGNEGYLNDLWEFNPSTDQWVWMGGSNTFNQPGVYGTLGVPAAGNIPGSRQKAVSWTDSSRNLWLFGGWGLDANGNEGFLNDLWEFNPSTNEWAWMDGSSTLPNPALYGLPGVYGTLGTAAAGNIPGTRASAVSWTDSNGNLWLFGGGGFDANGNMGNLNDLWRYQPSTATVPAAATPTFSVAPGSYLAPQTVSISDTTPFANIYYTTDGTEPATTSTLYSGPISVSSTETLEAIAAASDFTASTAATAAYTITGPVLVSPTPGSTLAAASSTTFTWTPGSGITKYELYLSHIGVGSDDLYRSGEITATSVTVSNLPANGTILYATLYCWANGVEHWTGYTFTEAGTPTPLTLAALTSPPPGSVLGASGATFTWTPGSGVVAYYLSLGTKGAGSRDLAAGPGSTALSLTVPSLPSNGETIYATLYSKIAGSGVWQSAGYTSYTESGTAAAPAPAVLDTPTPGSTLAASGATFDWTPGSHVWYYALYVGTIGPGSNNLYDSGAITGTSVTVSNLPANGLPVYARLYSKVNGSWQWTDYAYVAQ
jgi:N-acetylneuraminic acid mutarotase